MTRKGLFFVLTVTILTTLSWKSSENTTVVKKAEVPEVKVIPNEITFDMYAQSFYSNLANEQLNFEAFKIALKGFLYLKQNNKLKNTKFLTVIDFSRHSKQERLFLIDMEQQELVHKSVVAHGRNSGLNFAEKFSNKVNSHQSSLGFYATAETYSGKHGYSLRLDGLEFSNSNARTRAIVIHSADYASMDFVKKNGRLGRSYGCPSLPKKGYNEVIGKIKEGSCLFIYAPKKDYLSKSELVNTSKPTVLKDA